MIEFDPSEYKFDFGTTSTSFPSAAKSVSPTVANQSARVARSEAAPMARQGLRLRRSDLLRAANNCDARAGRDKNAAVREACTLLALAYRDAAEVLRLYQDKLEETL